MDHMKNLPLQPLGGGGRESLHNHEQIWGEILHMSEVGEILHYDPRDYLSCSDLRALTLFGWDRLG